VERTELKRSADDSAARFQQRWKYVEVVELGATITKSFTFVEVLPILMSSLVADATAAVYALANRSGRAGPGMTTKPRSCNSEVASIGSSFPAANVLNQSNIIIIWLLRPSNAGAEAGRAGGARYEIKAGTRPCQHDRLAIRSWLLQ
jgi:hypothetical protein